MRELLIITILILVLSGCNYNQLATSTESESNPWIPEEHIADKNGYLHDFPCHAGESARISYKNSGCYIWEAPIKEDYSECKIKREKLIKFKEEITVEMWKAEDDNRCKDQNELFDIQNNLGIFIEENYQCDNEFRFLGSKDIYLMRCLE